MKRGSYPGERTFSFPWPLIEVLLYSPGGQSAETWIGFSFPSSAQAKNERRCKIYSYACKWWTGKTSCTSLKTALHYSTTSNQQSNFVDTCARYRKHFSSDCDISNPDTRPEGKGKNMSNVERNVTAIKLPTSLKRIPWIFWSMVREGGGVTVSSTSSPKSIKKIPFWRFGCEERCNGMNMFFTKLRTKFNMRYFYSAILQSQLPTIFP